MSTEHSEEEIKPVQEINDDIAQCCIEEKNLAQARIETLEAELAQLNEKYNETYERLMRIAAESDNLRKRMEKEKADIRMYSIQDFAKDLLPLIDAFDKAMLALQEANIASDTQENSQLSAIVEGVQLVSKTFTEAIKKHGIERLPGKGAPFNPALHNAIAKVVDATLTQETVLDEYMAGYKIADRILRTAMVRVGSPD